MKSKAKQILKAVQNGEMSVDAHDILGDKVVAVTARSCSFPVRELNEAKAFCQAEGIRQIIVESEELAIEEFSQNPKNRCYLCKRELFAKIRRIAGEHGIPYVVEGSNMDDDGDYRPGLTAVAELDIKSPLREAKLKKVDIRCLSKEMGYPHGMSRPVPVLPHGLFTERPSPKKNFLW